MGGHGHADPKRLQLAAFESDLLIKRLRAMFQLHRSGMKRHMPAVLPARGGLSFNLVMNGDEQVLGEFLRDYFRARTEMERPSHNFIGRLPLDFSLQPTRRLTARDPSRAGSQSASSATAVGRMGWT